MVIDRVDGTSGFGFGALLRRAAQSPSLCLVAAPIFVLGLCMYLLAEYGAGFIVLFLVAIACGLPCIVAKEKFRAARPREHKFEITFTSMPGA